MYLGTGKSFIFSKIMAMHQLKRQYDLKIEESRLMESGTVIDKNKNYRHAILNEVNILENLLLLVGKVKSFGGVAGALTPNPARQG